MTTATPTATETDTGLDIDVDLEGSGGLFDGPPVADEDGVRRYGDLPAVVHHRAVGKLGEREARSKFWGEDHRRAVAEAAGTEKFRAICRANEVSPGTVVHYLFACMQDSDRFGKDISTGVKKLASRIGKSDRQLYRARRVARLTEFERFAIRAWQEPSQGNTYKRTSSLVRPMIPAWLAQKVVSQRLNAAKRVRAGRRRSKSGLKSSATSSSDTAPLAKHKGCKGCGGVGTVSMVQSDGSTLAAWCPSCGPP